MSYLFHQLDFSILSQPDFKEDSVREVLILPLLHELGYKAMSLNQIIRSRKLIHPFVAIGSQKRKINLVPDYMLTVANKPAWILDAKSPHEPIESGKHVEQAYSYAIHPEIRAKYFALCNGHAFILFRPDHAEPVLYVHLSELYKHWQTFYELLAPTAFKQKKAWQKSPQKELTFDYSTITPLPEITDLRKQATRRHFGVHPYFTKQVWNVVQEYIKNFSQPHDLVLDPYGGSGVTALEALVLGRRAIHIDLNPLSIFMVKNLLMPVNISQLTEAYNHIRETFEAHAPQTDAEIEHALQIYPYPKGIKLPKNSDVDTIEKLFSSSQLAQLAYLKYLIKQVEDAATQNTLMLSFSSAINRFNLTFHYTKSGGGDGSIFRYYRYRIAPRHDELDLMHADYELEAIEGGELKKSKADYADLLAESIREMYRVLKFERWMSFVFAHKDPAYWHLIVDTAEQVGFEYMGAVKQSNNKTTFKKRQNPFTVLSGQLIINFRKAKNPVAIMKSNLGMDIADMVIETIEEVIAEHDGATL